MAGTTPDLVATNHVHYTTDIGERLIGCSAAVRDLEQEVECAARSDAKVLITGESGVGKEILARLIHRRSARAHAQLLTINCAGLPDSLLESELFGHVRGAFTGAYRDKVGLLEMAHRGTIFMDEVGEMSLRMQALLLRFLESGEIQRVGSDRPQTRVDVRVIAATNRNLIERIATKDFREDLYYRLNVIHLTVPPLRERREDIPDLLDYFLRAYAERHGVPTPTLVARGALAAGRLPLGRQRPRAEELRRAPGAQDADRPHHAGGPAVRADPGPGGAAAADRSAARSCESMCRSDGQRPRVVLDGGLRAVHAARPDARRSARHRQPRPRADARQLPDPRDALRHGSEATTSGS